MFSRIWNYLKAFWAILIDRVPPGQWSWVYRAFHWTAIIVTAGLLGWYSDHILGYFGQGRESVNSTELIKTYFCCWLFLAAYGFIRTVLFAIGLFSWRDSSEFPDIEDAWDRGLQVLDRLGYDIRDFPVFAVLGATPATESSFFSSAGIEWKAVVPPREEDALAPLRLYLSEKACYVSLTNVGVYARQLVNTEMAAPDAATRGVGGGRVLGNLGATQHPNPQLAGMSSATPTMTPQQFASMNQPPKTQPAISAAAAPSQSAAAGPQMTMRPGMLQVGGDPDATVRPSSAATRQTLPAPLEQSQTALGLRRLSYFLRLLKTDREPFCGLNGLLAVLPVRWSSSPDSCELLNSLKQDLQRVRTDLRLSFPIVTLLSDVETLSGFRVFLERMRRLEPQIEDKTRAGTRCPMGAVLDRRHSEWVVDKSIEWFRDWIFRLFAVTIHDAARNETYRGLDDASNRDLYALLCAFQKRRATLARQLELVFRPAGELPARFSGYYIAAKEPSRAFLRGVLQKLEDEQNEVAYLPSSCRGDRRLKAWATLAALCGLALVIADGILAWQLIQRFS